MGLMECVMSEAWPIPSGGAILRQAADAIEGDRQKTHGSKEECFGTMSDYLTTFMQWRKAGGELDPHESALIMILWKIARIQAGQADFEDHYRDIAGYAGCAWECVKPK